MTALQDDQPIRITEAPDLQLEPGLHQAHVTSATMRPRANRFGKIFTALHLEFTDERGARATAMVADFTGLIPTAFQTLGADIDAQQPISGELLLYLRGRTAEIHVVHKPSGGKVYANVTAINGILVTK
jgi:hypothetical protein